MNSTETPCVSAFEKMGLGDLITDPYYEGIFCGAMKLTSEPEEGWYHIIFKVLNFSTHHIQMDLKETAYRYSLVVKRARIQPIEEYDVQFQYRHKEGFGIRTYCSRGIILPTKELNLDIPEDQEIRFWGMDGQFADKFGFQADAMPFDLEEAGFRIRSGRVFKFKQDVAFNLNFVEPSTPKVNLVNVQDVELCDSSLQQPE